MTLREMKDVSDLISRSPRLIIIGENPVTHQMDYIVAGELNQYETLGILFAIGQVIIDNDIREDE